MELFKIISVAIVSTILIVYLKHINSELTILLSVCCGILLLIMTLEYVGDFLQLFNNIASLSGIDNSVIKIILKITAISYLIEFSITTIEDFGLKSIADKVLFAGKIFILILSAPIIENLITTVIGLI